MGHQTTSSILCCSWTQIFPNWSDFLDMNLHTLNLHASLQFLQFATSYIHKKKFGTMHVIVTCRYMHETPLSIIQTVVHMIVTTLQILLGISGTYLFACSIQFQNSFHQDVFLGINVEKEGLVISVSKCSIRLHCF